MKTAYKNAANKLKGSFTLIDSIKSTLRADLDRINADTWTSDSRKAQLRAEATEAARSKLANVRATIDEAAAEMSATADALVNRFDYTDPKLTAAINFLNTYGADTPREAASQIISDFKEQPAALKMITKTFDKHGLGASSIEAAEELGKYKGLATLSQRASDSAYYATAGDITEAVSFSGLVSEIDSVGAALGVEGV